MDYLVYQLEKCPHTGKLHWQCFVICKKLESLKGIKKLFNDDKLHVERMRGSRLQARRYCSPEKVEDKQTWIAGTFFEWGVFKHEPGKRTDLDNIKSCIEQGFTNKEIASEFFSQWVRYEKSFTKFKNMCDADKPHEIKKKQIIWIHGKTGKGKTEWCYENYDHFWKAHSYANWFDGYEEREVVLFDEMMPGCMKPEMFLQLTDRYPMEVPVKGAFTKWCPKTILFTSNFHPDKLFESVDKETLAAIKRRITFIKCLDEEPIVEDKASQ